MNIFCFQKERPSIIATLARISSSNMERLHTLIFLPLYKVRHIALISLRRRTLRLPFHAFNVKLRRSCITKPIPNVTVIMGNIVDNVAHVIIDDCDIFVMWLCALRSEKGRFKGNVSALLLVFGRRDLLVGLHQVSCCLESSEGIELYMFFWSFREMIETAIIHFFMFAFVWRNQISSSIMQPSLV